MIFLTVSFFGKTVTSTRFVFWGGSVTETVTSASVSALGAGAAKSSISDAYDRLKAIIRRNWGVSGPVNAALEEKSETRPGVAKEKIHSDAEVRIAVRQLAAQLIAESMRSSPLPSAMFNISGGATKGVAGAANIGPVTRQLAKGLIGPVNRG